jgi:hypothetical protein
VSVCCTVLYHVVLCCQVVGALRPLHSLTSSPRSPQHTRHAQDKGTGQPLFSLTAECGWRLEPLCVYVSMYVCLCMCQCVWWCSPSSVALKPSLAPIGTTPSLAILMHAHPTRPDSRSTATE